jgi:hypothetical protein
MIKIITLFLLISCTTANKEAAEKKDLGIQSYLNTPLIERSFIMPDRTYFTNYGMGQVIDDLLELSFEYKYHYTLSDNTQLGFSNALFIPSFRHELVNSPKHKLMYQIGPHSYIRTDLTTSNSTIPFFIFNYRFIQSKKIAYTFKINQSIGRHYYTTSVDTFLSFHYQMTKKDTLTASLISLHNKYDDSDIFDYDGISKDRTPIEIEYRRLAYKQTEIKLSLTHLEKDHFSYIFGFNWYR